MKKVISFLLLAFCFATVSAQDRMLDVVLPAGTPSTIVQHEGYTVSFNDEARIPNYVIYHLFPSDITTEGVSRDGEMFVADPDIPGCPESTEYNRSNFPKGFHLDRGHMMPAADCKTSATRMTESFYLSNVCPQDHDLNEGQWCELEKQVRFWCKHWYKQDLYVVCGPIFDDSCQKSETGIVIPKAFFKVICRRDDKKVWSAIGFRFLNSPMLTSYETLAVSVDDIEKATGFDFFSTLPDSIERFVEKDCSGWKF